MVKFHELGQIELGLLQDLHLADEHVFKREDLGAVLGDLLAQLVGDELLEEFLEGALCALSNHDFHHLLAELSHVGSFGVASGLDLELVAAGEGNCEHADEVAIEGLGLNKGLNKGVPLLDEGAKLVAGNIHTVEVGVAVEALDFFNLDLDLSPGGLMSIVVELAEGDIEDTAAKGVSSNLWSVKI